MLLLSLDHGFLLDFESWLAVVLVDAKELVSGSRLYCSGSDEVYDMTIEKLEEKLRLRLHSGKGALQEGINNMLRNVQILCLMDSISTSAGYQVPLKRLIKYIA